MSSAAVEPPASTSTSSTTDSTSNSNSYIQTTTNSYVSRAATVDGAKFVELKGRSLVHAGARLRGRDRAPLRIGRYCCLARDCRIEPPPLVLPLLPPNNKNSSNNHPTQQQQYIPVTIGAHTVIGTGSQIRAAAIGSLCWLGRNVQAGPRCIIKDCCVVADNTVIPADTVIPPFHRAYNDADDGRFGTTPLPPSVAVELQERATDLYHEFVAAQKQNK